jgi:PAS domain S-box-containing protein
MDLEVSGALRKRSERELRQDQAELSAIYNSAPVLMILLDSEKRVRKFNRTASKLSGRSAEETIALRAGEALRCLHTLSDPVGCGFGEACEKCPLHLIVLKTFETGKCHHRVEVSLTLLRGGQHEERALVVSTDIVDVIEDRMVLVCIEDITHRKHVEEALERSEKKYRELYENLRDGFAAVKMDGKIIEYNPAFQQMLGYTAEEMYRLTYEDITPEKWHLFETEIVEEQVLKKGYSDIYEKEYIKKDGTTFPVELRTYLILDEGGRPAGMWAFVRDITERKRAEQELRRVNEELNTFVEVVSHDLKNPIISIQGFSSLLFRKYREKMDEKVAGYLEQINANAHRMEGLVSDLLTLSQVGRVVSTFENVPSAEIIQSVAFCLRHTLQEKGIELEVADNFPDIHCDVEKIRQVFENLLVNAIKFTGGTEDPRIEIGYEDLGEFHKFHLKDNGIGIDRIYHRKIFEKFIRLKEIEDVEGTGLGLAIVEKAVSSHRGNVWVESEKGKGATFYFAMPKIL